MGVDMGGDALYETAQGFGFDRDVPFDLPGGVQSNFPEEIVDDPPSSRGLDRPERRAGDSAADGVAAAVANDGVIMEPHVMSEIRDDQGNKVEEYDDEAFTQAMTPETAGTPATR